MKFKIKNIIFTDKTKDGKELINKNWEWFFMLHIEVIEDWESSIKANKFGKWISKYFNENKWDELKQKIKIWNIYNIEYKESWIYKNIVSIRDNDNNIII